MKCTHCGKEIEYLDVWTPGWAESRMYVTHCSSRGFMSDDTSQVDYNCPHCCNTLFHDKLEAEEFLKKKIRTTA